MGKGSNGNYKNGDPGVQKVKADTDQEGLEGAESGAQREKKKTWRFQLTESTLLANTLRGSEPVSGIVVDNRLQIEMHGQLLGYCPDEVAREIRAAMNGTTPEGEVADVRKGRAPTIELRL